MVKLQSQTFAGFDEFLYGLYMEFLQQCVELIQSGIEKSSIPDWTGSTHC